MPKFQNREEYLEWKENKAKQKKTTFKDIYKDLTKKEKFGIVLFIILFIFTIRYDIIPRYKTWLRRQVTEEIKKTEKVKKKPKKVSVDKHSVHGAWAYMQLFVKKDLKSPKSADFPFGGYRHVAYLGNKRYKVVSYVDSQNSFGAMIRTNFKGIITRINNGWKLEYLDFE